MMPSVLIGLLVTYPTVKSKTTKAVVILYTGVPLFVLLSTLDSMAALVISLHLIYGQPLYMLSFNWDDPEQAPAYNLATRNNPWFMQQAEAEMIIAHAILYNEWFHVSQSYKHKQKR